MPRAAENTQINQTQVELPALPVVSVLASNWNRPDVAIPASIPLVVTNLGIPLTVPNPNIPLVVQMANLMAKGRTMLNSLPVWYPIWFGRLLSTEPYVTEIEQQDAQLVLGLPDPSSVVVDNDLSPESDVVETRPPKRTHINLEASEYSHERPLVRRHSPTENRRSTGSRQDSRTQSELHKRLRTELLLQKPRSLGNTSITSEPQTLSDSTSATSKGKIPRKFWKQEYIPPENSLVYDTAKLHLQAEVSTGQPWPSAAITENMVERAWALALEQRKREKKTTTSQGIRGPRSRHYPFFLTQCVYCW